MDALKHVPLEKLKKLEERFISKFIYFIQYHQIIQILFLILILLLKAIKKKIMINQIIVADSKLPKLSTKKKLLLIHLT